MPLNWPTLPETHTAVTVIDDLFDRLGVTRRADVTTRHTDAEHTYHHFRCVTEFDGELPDDISGTHSMDDASIDIERVEGGRARMLVDTGRI